MTSYTLYTTFIVFLRQNRSEIMCHLAKSMNLKNDLWWPTLTPAVQVETRVFQIWFSEHHSWILHAKWLKNMYRMTTFGYKNMVTFSDLILTWPGHATSLTVSKHLAAFKWRLSMKYEAHSFHCLISVALQPQKPRFWQLTSVWPWPWPQTLN